MGFGWGGVWGMGYGRFMGYAMHFPMNQLGGHKMASGTNLLASSTTSHPV